jgi:hypothetical protein
MDTDSSVSALTPPERAVAEKAGRPPPVVLRSAANFIQLKKQIKTCPDRSSSYVAGETGPE